jgi:hypothetical protein
MNFLKRCSLITLCLIPFYSLALTKPVIQATENTGIAFIHGTNDHRTDAIGGYWNAQFIESVVSGLPNPENYAVIHCDFRQFMWTKEGAGCMAEQMTTFIEDKHIKDMIVITHSDGANVMRWLMSNPTYDSRYPKIIHTTRWVNAIAPSSGGTPLADMAVDGTIFESGVSWLIGYKTNSVKQQRTGDMYIYNKDILDGGQGKPSLAKPFYNVIGTDVSMSPLNSDNYCGGYLYNVALKVTKLYLDNCADGFLNCTSQAAAGDVWFYDYEKTDRQKELNHNQTRAQCFGLDQILIEDI